MNYENVKIIVNGVELPPAVSFDYGLEDMDADSERDVNSGVLYRNRIRSDMLKISVAYAVNDTTSISNVLKAISPATFSVEVYDFKEGKRITKTMYAGPKSFQPVCLNGVWVKSLKFNLVEV